MGEIIYKKQFHREPIDETEPEVANFTDSGNAPSFDEIMKGFGAIHCCTAFLKRG